MPEQFFANREHFEAEVAKAKAESTAEIAKLKQQIDKLIANERMAEGKTVGKTTEGVVITADALHVPRALAQNPQDYQRWKSNASQQGKELKIIAETPAQTPEKAPDRYVSERTGIIYLARHVAQDSRQYQYEKAQAEKNNMRLVVCYQPHDFPTEAFLTKETPNAE